MRRIEKRPEPVALTAWRSANQGLPNCGYAALSRDAAAAVKSQAVAEQGQLCAYTGLRIAEDTSHIEHLLPQQHCTDAESVTYSNLVACYPATNYGGRVEFGARQKANWPSREEWYLFVSPLGENCEARFSYDRHGNIKPANPDDQAAVETIRRLRLDHPVLNRFRREALRVIDGLNLKEARTRLRNLQTQHGTLDQFCFVLKPALARYICTLEAIIASRGRR